MALLTRARAAALLAAALAGAARPVRAQTTTPLRLASLPIENAAELFFAHDLGFFAKAGIDAEIQRMMASSAVLAGVVSNQVEIGWSTVDVLAIAHSKGIKIAVVAPASEFHAPETEKIAALVVGADSAVHQAKDLNGKTIATGGLNSIAETAPRAWIDKNGGDSSTVKFIEVPIPAMPSALDEGRVAAANIVEPYIDEAVRGGGRVLGYTYDAIGSEYIIGTWCATRAWADAHPDLVKRFAGVIHQTAIWGNQVPMPPQFPEILAKYSRMKPEQVTHLTRSHYAEQFTPALMQPLIDVSARYNGFPTFPAEQLMWSAPK